MASWKTYLQIVGCIFLLCFGIPLRKSNTNNNELEEKFKSFLKQFNKTYDNANEYQQRFEAFQKSLTEINSLNANRTNNQSAIYGLTKYSDITKEKFREDHLRFHFERPKVHKHDSIEDDSTEVIRKKRALKRNLPMKVDWRDKGFVSDVKNQKYCGACWAFCTIENVETMYAKKMGKLKHFSVQQMIDCAGYGNNGCDGGDMCSLLSWLHDNKIVIQNEYDYPLTLKNQTCKINKNVTGIQIADFICERRMNEDLIMTLLAKNGPVSVAINAISWQNYLGGVIQYHCNSLPNLLNHAVQIVGYNRAAEIPYYIVRNSWGKDFGDNGYLYLAIGSNICGLTNEVTALSV